MSPYKFYICRSLIHEAADDEHKYDATSNIQMPFIFSLMNITFLKMDLK
jgi:hypothetical protein